MGSTIDRRSFVVVAPAVLATTAAGTALAAAASADAELLALGPRWRQAYQAYDDTFAPLAEAERAYFSAKRPLPKQDAFDGSEAQFVMATAVVKLENERLYAEAGCSELTRRQHEAAAAVVELADEIFEISAKTKQGIRLKVEILRAHKDWESPDMESSLWADLLNMAEVYDA